MNKAYYLAPLIALIVFTGFYLSYRSGLAERDAAKAAAAEAALKAKNDADLEARRAAMTEAIAAAEQRKVEREARLAQEAADKAARQSAIDARDKAFREQERTARQIDRVQKEITETQASLAALAATRQDAETEKAFLLEFVAKAQTNVQALQALLTRLNAPAPATASAVPAASR